MFKFKNIFLVLLCGSLVYANTPKEPDSIYVKVGNLVLESEDHVVKPVSGVGAATAPQKEEKQGLDLLFDKVNETLKPLSSLHKKEVVFNFLAQHGQLKQTTHAIEPYVLHELSVICGSERSKKVNLLTHLNKTHTTFGTAVLARMLAEPLISKSVIEKRQKMVKLLLENQELFDTLDKALRRIKLSEDHFLNFWNPSAQLDPNTKNLVWFGKFFDSCNKKPLVLQLARLDQLFSIGSAVALYGGLTIALPAAAAFNSGNQNRAGFDGRAALGGFLSGCIGSAFTFFVTKQIYQIMKLINEITYISHKRLSSVSNINRSLAELYDITNDQEEIISGIKSYDKLREFVVNPEEISEDLEKLQKLLESDLFKKEPKWYSYLGKALAAHRYMDDVKDSFIPALEAAGELDAYLSIAKLLKEYKSNRVKYCFVNFVEKDSPLIALEAVWNPLIDTDKVVTEDIVFGKPNYAHNIMLTGPHGGGKSTFMKSVAYSIILGQTFGIAPAANATCTIFDKINSYVNIKEDLGAGQSTFMAEKKRVDEILYTLTHLEPNQLSFTIMDEVFKGTMEDEGSRRLYNFGKAIAPIQNSMSMIATHFARPADLEEETKEFTNYHVGLIEQPDKTFIRTFKLIKGKNEWWFNDRDKRERYIDWLTTIN